MGICVILTDQQIRKAIKEGNLVVDPEPRDDQFSPTALDLHISEDIRRFKESLYTTRGLDVSVVLDKINIPDLAPHMEPMPRNGNGSVVLMPRDFVIALTLESIELPPNGKLAARVEGRSRFARLGLTVHMTAPTIHNSFRGPITLEIMNHGPLPLCIKPGVTRICQLIFERIDEPPGAELSSPFQGQNSPLGRQ